MWPVVCRTLHDVTLILQWCFLRFSFSAVNLRNKAGGVVQLCLWSIIFILFALIKIDRHFSFSLVKHEKLPPYRLLLQKSPHFKVHGDTPWVRAFAHLILCVASACNLSPLLCYGWILHLLASRHLFHFPFTWEFKWNKLVEWVLYLLLKLCWLLNHLSQVTDFLWRW